MPWARFQIEHIRAKQHGGSDDLDNLALACRRCNRRKGTDIASVTSSTGQLTRLFNPRTDRWEEHFELKGVIINARTSIGEATARLLGFNEPERVLERKILHRIGRYPSEEAKKY